MTIENYYTNLGVTKKEELFILQRDSTMLRNSVVTMLPISLEYLYTLWVFDFGLKLVDKARNWDIVEEYKYLISHKTSGWSDTFWNFGLLHCDRDDAIRIVYDTSDKKLEFPEPVQSFTYCNNVLYGTEFQCFIETSVEKHLRIALLGYFHNTQWNWKWLLCESPHPLISNSIWPLWSYGKIKDITHLTEF